MTFTKENAGAMGKRGVEMRKKYKEDMLEYVVSGGLRKGMVVLDMLLDGDKVTAEQKEGLRMLEKFINYKKGKMSTLDGNLKVDEKVMVVLDETNKV